MKRVLVVTYYFPPSGGPGVQRALKFVKYLPEFGWQPVVLTVDPEFASYPDEDELLCDEIPRGLEVIRTRSRDPYAAYARLTGKSKEQSVGVGFLGDKEPGVRERVARWLRANVFLPDARVGWVRYAVRAARSRLEAGDISAVFTTGPPQSTHLVGERIVKSSGVPWVADLRDLWPDPAYQKELPMTDWARKRDAETRNRVLNKATECLAVTGDMARRTAEQTGRSVRVISNGYDPDDFRRVSPARMDGCSLVHTGNLSPARNPSVLWYVLAKAVACGKWPQLNVVLVGNVDVSIRKSIQEAGLRHRVRHVPYVPHAEAISYMKGSDLLLLPINRVEGASGIVTGKLFEYLACGQPVLCIGPAEGEAADIIHGAGAGVVIDYEDAESVEAYLDTVYSGWESNEPVSGAAPEHISSYSRRDQTRSLADLFDKVCSGADHRSSSVCRTGGNTDSSRAISPGGGIGS